MDIGFTLFTSNLCTILKKKLNNINLARSVKRPLCIVVNLKGAFFYFVIIVNHINIVTSVYFVISFDRT